jgi:hypothetical protein
MDNQHRYKVTDKSFLSPLFYAKNKVLFDLNVIAEQTHFQLLKYANSVRAITETIGYFTQETIFFADIGIQFALLSYLIYSVLKLRCII